MRGGDEGGSQAHEPVVDDDAQVTFARFIGLPHDVHERRSRGDELIGAVFHLNFDDFRFHGCRRFQKWRLLVEGLKKGREP